MKNTSSRSARFAALRTAFSGFQDQVPEGPKASRTIPSPSIASEVRGTLHDLYAASPADVVAVNAFGLGLAVEAAAGRPIVWAMDDMTAHEAGRPYGPGLNEMGVPPRDVVLVRARDTQTLLGVAEEALRSPAVGAVVLSAWGESRALTLTASRRLLLASRTANARLYMARAGADPSPSAAETRWSIRALASTPLEGDAPGRPAFSAALLRHRGGGTPRTLTVEWDRDQRLFVERSHAGPALFGASLSGDLVPLAAYRQTPAREGHIRRVA